MKTRFVFAIGLAWVLFAGNFAAQSGNAQPHQAFRLFGTATDDVDPENPANEVVSIDTIGFAFGGAIRDLKVKIETLDNQLEFKSYYAAGRSCGGGSPRIQLAIDLDGDGRSDGNAFGFTVPISGCPPMVWRFDDLTDELLRWELGQFAPEFAAAGITQPAYVIPWSGVEAIVGLFPNHEVLTGALVDDTFPGSPAGQGRAFYDIVTIGNRTISNHQDTARGSRP